MADPWALPAAASPPQRAAIERLWVRARQAELAGEWEEAAAAYRQAEELDPQNPVYPTNLANALWWADRAHEPEALEASRRACRLGPEEVRPWLGLGNLLRDLNRYEEAEQAFGRAMALGNEASTTWNFSQTLLGLERYGLAYGLAERRLELVQQLQPFRSGPYWQGWPETRGRAGGGGSELPQALTVWSEQGYGDTLQYVRWLVPLLRQGVRVRLEVEGPLVRLMEQGLAWVGGALEVVSKNDSSPPDLVQEPCQGSLLSLPHRLGGAPLAEVFRNGGGYLRSGTWQAEPTWPLGRSGRRSRRPRVGLVWAAGRKFNDPVVTREYRRRSLPAAELQRLMEGLLQQGVELVNLQLGHDQRRAGRWRHRCGATLAATSDFAETAHWIQHLDLLITVDTAYAHLAGALAQRTWVLLPYAPDPRWLRQRADSPWYPSLRLWRQPRPGDWEAVVGEILKAFSPGGAPMGASQLPTQEKLSSHQIAKSKWH